MSRLQELSQAPSRPTFTVPTTTPGRLRQLLDVPLKAPADTPTPEQEALEQPLIGEEMLAMMPGGQYLKGARKLSRLKTLAGEVPKELPPITPAKPSALQTVKPDASKWRQAWDKEKAKWGQELPVLEAAPESPVISQIEGHHVWMELQADNFVRQPWVQTLMKAKPDEWKKLEAQAVSEWTAGGQTPESYQAAVSRLPEPFQQMLKARDTLYQMENEVRVRRGLPEIPHQPGPYFPRMTSEEWRDLRQVARGYGSGGKDVRSTVGGFQQPRTFETQAGGEAYGIEYADPREAMLMREAKGVMLRATDQLITGWEQAGILHKTREAAQAVSPTGEAWPLEGMPFAPEGGRWWVRTKEEAQFIRQNLRPMPEGLRGLSHFATAFVRNPSLINPLPHLLKNMLYKYGLQTFVSGGKMRHLVTDWNAYRNGTADLLDEFKAVMPFTESGKTFHQILFEVGPKTPWEQIENAAAQLNRYSQKKIFAEWDPALRYSKWREYVRQGMSPQEAANHTWIDLVRYGTRSDRIDFWKSLPLNFFVPWRTGTVRTLNKALQSNPTRALLFIGAVDYLREMDYRTNGRWTHLPIDYPERPLATLLAGKPTEAMATAIATALAGPGGEYFMRSMSTMIRDLELKGQKSDLRNLFWGMAQVYDLMPQFTAWEQDGNPQHMVDALGLILVGRHGTPYGAPHRLWEFLPESLPGLEKSEAVKRAEHLREVLERKGDIRNLRLERRWERKSAEPMRP